MGNLFKYLIRLCLLNMINHLTLPFFIIYSCNKSILTRTNDNDDKCRNVVTQNVTSGTAQNRLTGSGKCNGISFVLQ